MILRLTRKLALSVSFTGKGKIHCLCFYCTSLENVQFLLPVRSSVRFFLGCIIIQFLEPESIMANLKAEIDILIMKPGGFLQEAEKRREKHSGRKASMMGSLRLKITISCSLIILFLCPGCLIVFKFCEEEMDAGRFRKFIKAASRFGDIISIL